MKMKYQEEHHVPTKSLMIDRILRELLQKMNFHKAQNQTVNPIQLAARTLKKESIGDHLGAGRADKLKQCNYHINHIFTLTHQLIMLTAIKFPSIDMRNNGVHAMGLHDWYTTKG